MILQRLPTHSHYRTAQRNDPEFVAHVLEHSDELDDQVWRPRPEDFGLTEALLAEAVDALGAVHSALMDLPVAPGKKKRTRPPKRFARPQTAVDRARKDVGTRADESHRLHIESLVEAAQQRWEAKQQKAG